MPIAPPWFAECIPRNRSAIRQMLGHEAVERDPIGLVHLNELQTELVASGPPNDTEWDHQRHLVAWEGYLKLKRLAFWNGDASTLNEAARARDV